MSLQDYNPNKLGKAAGKHRARGYQLEMLEESLKENIIVAVFNTPSCLLVHTDQKQMDTGSGKTHM